MNSGEMEIVPVISADSRELYFCRHYEDGGEDIFEHVGQESMDHRRTS